MKHFFVINPYSFRNQEKLKQVCIDIEKSFPGKMDYIIYLSRYPRDAIAVVHHYISSCPENEIVRVYAVGGDGILFDCLNGMVGFPNAELTNVPYGNDNDFIRAFGENKKDRFRDIKSLSLAPSLPVDIINCGSNYALIEIHIGLIGQTMILAKEMFKTIPEKLLRNHVSKAYMFCMLRALFNKNVMQQRYSMFMDGEDLSGNFCYLHAANSACNGETFVPSPYARPDSGKLEVIYVNTTSKISILKSAGDYNEGLFEKHKIFERRQCRVLELQSDDIMSVSMDGETFYAQKIKLEIIPKGIKFFAPEGLSLVDYSYKAFAAADKQNGGNRK